MKTYKIGVMGGDGTGPEVIQEGVKILNVLQEKAGFKLEYTDFDFGGDRYIKTGEVLPESACADLAQNDAIYLGAIGHPDVKPGILEKGILLKVRFELDQYINLRPVKLYPGVWTPIKDKGPEEIDFVVIRENSGGIYTGGGGIIKKNTPNEVAIQEMVYTRFEVDRCLKYAFDYTRKRNKNKTLTLCGKTNVLTYVFDLWERAFLEMGEKEYSDLKCDYAHIDATTMWMVKNPEWFDVIVTSNMFGDIITDLGAMVQGGMGVAAGGNINPDEGGCSMFEPIGGSAPKYTGQNVINPIACIAAGQMMLEHLGEDKAAKMLDTAISQFLGSGVLPGLSVSDIKKAGMSTTKIGDAIAQLVQDM
ncbi:MAG: 3-isopropylmalate dehydrogenase [Candidatus Hinthialibacter antarcticus]|nr:3-isopropylmalate dehydrogenase [Candidatus Hinthialibacter antarcticus]